MNERTNGNENVAAEKSMRMAEWNERGANTEKKSIHFSPIFIQ